MNPYIKSGPWIPILRSVRGSLYSGRSKGPIFKSVRGFLYSGRSMDLYMHIGPWIPILRSVRGSLSSGRSANPFIQNGPWIPICGSIRGFLSSDRSADPYILSGPWIPHKPLFVLLAFMHWISGLPLWKFNRLLDALWRPSFLLKKLVYMNLDHQWSKFL